MNVPLCSSAPSGWIKMKVHTFVLKCLTCRSSEHFPISLFLQGDRTASEPHAGRTPRVRHGCKYFVPKTTSASVKRSSSAARMATCHQWGYRFLSALQQRDQARCVPASAPHLLHLRIELVDDP